MPTRILTVIRDNMCEQKSLLPSWERVRVRGRCQSWSPSPHSFRVKEEEVNHATNRKQKRVGLDLVLAVFLLFGITQPLNAQSLKKIRIASKGALESLVAYVIPQRLGFYREEGLDPDVIVTRGTVTTQVVVSGAVDYSNGGSIPAILAVRG